MRTVKALRFAAAAVVALIAGIVIISQVSAGAGAVVAVSSATISPGSTGDVNLEARDIGSPGLGAWDVGIVYDSSLLTAVSCSGEEGSVCNTNFASNRVQVVGANASGLDGTNVLATVTFRCNREGSAELSLVVEEFSDATTGAPQPMSPDINSGRITCSDSAGLPDVPSSPSSDDVDEDPITGLPSSGAGGSTSSSVNWLIAALAAIGLVAMTALGASRLLEQRWDT